MDDWMDEKDVGSMGRCMKIDGWWVDEWMVD